VTFCGYSRHYDHHSPVSTQSSGTNIHQLITNKLSWTMKMPNTCRVVTMRFVYHLAIFSVYSPSECRTMGLTIQTEKVATTVGL